MVLLPAKDQADGSSAPSRQISVANLLLALPVLAVAILQSGQFGAVRGNLRGLHFTGHGLGFRAQVPAFQSRFLLSNRNSVVGQSRTRLEVAPGTAVWGCISRQPDLLYCLEYKRGHM